MNERKMVCGNPQHGSRRTKANGILEGSAGILGSLFRKKFAAARDIFDWDTVAEGKGAKSGG